MKLLRYFSITLILLLVSIVNWNCNDDDAIQSSFKDFQNNQNNTDDPPLLATLSITVFQNGSQTGDCPSGTVQIKEWTHDFYCIACSECGNKFFTLSQEFYSGSCLFNTVDFTVNVSGTWYNLQGNQGPTMKWYVTSTACDVSSYSFFHYKECTPVTGGYYSNSFNTTNLQPSTWYKFVLVLTAFADE